jgi:hypothetical protein
MANTLAYYDMATITAIKCFIVQAPGQILIFPSILNEAFVFKKFVKNFVFEQSKNNLRSDIFRRNSRNISYVKLTNKDTKTGQRHSAQISYDKLTNKHTKMTLRHLA